MMGELIFIGVGLDGGKGITLRGLDEARSADVVYAERYTSALSDTSLDAIERLIERPVHRLSRKEVEDGEAILGAALRGRVAFLVGGDPMAATTHVDLRLRAASRKIPTQIVHGVSILTAAAGALGLQIYKFGRTTTVPFASDGFTPTSPLEAILQNRRAGLHSLVLLDLREDGSSLAPADAIASVLRMASTLGSIDFGPDVLAAVLSRVGTPDVRAFVGPISRLARWNLGPPPHCIIIPGNLHFLEKEALVAFAGAPHDL
jgi:diphthine synthase